jgi:anti-repressor protein
MDDLIKITGETISSKVIAEITGKQHSNVMQDVRNLLDQLGDEKGGLTFQLSSYFGDNGKQNAMYELTKKEALLLASGYNAILRLKIIDRLEELEKIKPRTHLEVLKSEMALLIESERIKNELLIASSNSILVRQFAKDLCDSGFEIGQNRLFEWLRDNKYLNSQNEPYQQFIAQGLFEVITRSIGSGEETFTTKTTKITGKGQVYFAQKIKNND